MQIEDEVLGLNLDIAVSRRLLHFDRAEAETGRKLLAHEVSKTLLGTEKTTETRHVKGPPKK